MDNETLNFEEHRRRLEEGADTVRCARCGGWITAAATRCPECGVHFQGEAQDFTHPSEMPQTSARLSPWIIAVAVLLLLGMAIGILGLV